MNENEVEKSTQFDAYIEDADGIDDRYAKAFSTGFFVAWQVDEKDPFEHFLNKYGRKVREVGIGQKVQIDVPDGIKVLEMKVPVGQLWMR